MGSLYTLQRETTLKEKEAKFSELSWNFLSSPGTFRYTSYRRYNAMTTYEVWCFLLKFGSRRQSSGKADLPEIVHKYYSPFKTRCWNVYVKSVCRHNGILIQGVFGRSAVSELLTHTSSQSLSQYWIRGKSRSLLTCFSVQSYGTRGKKYTYGGDGRTRRFPLSPISVLFVICQRAYSATF
jgi:hypothetical protein